MNWREYEEATAEFFRSLGYTATVGQKLEGARGRHDVDVVVRFKKHAFECVWLIECKFWSSKVSKEEVLAFQGIIEDVGADKGILLSEEGFQSGCFSCANRTNILLSSLSELRDSHKDDLHHAFIDSLLIELERASSRARKLAPDVRTSKPGDKVQSWSSKFPLELLGRISIVEMSLRKYRDGKLPVVVGFEDGDEEKPVVANNVDDIIAAQRDVLQRIEQLCARLEANG